MSEFKETPLTPKTERRLITIKARHSTPLYERPIPPSISDSAISKESLPVEIPSLGSSIIEDFVINKIESDIASPDQISAAFVDENISEQVKQYLDQLQDYSQSLDWERIFTSSDAKQAQAVVCQEMSSLGISPEKISRIAKMNITITESAGVSFPTDEGISVSQLQIVRNALDYVHVYGDSIPIEQIISAYMKSVIKHEFGHQIDKILGDVSNSIPSDKNWGDDNNYERRSERFAEYWGRLGDLQEQQISQRIAVMHLAKVRQLWNAIGNYNQTHEYKADFSGIFNSIRNNIERNSNVMDLFDARLHLYSGNVAENYALPYSQDTVTSAINANYK